ncbi:hypothetical protein QAD02_007846 [Eretmocerus hayati]|uniref:Uncharacterized protein n=1 Tax=Eretmocerus hayati TaxID=131215 RepID=A0ACC2N779_9HYME|nr:hypothetical protein QAD02_007846 [Eretmocerus hayati]
MGFNNPDSTQYVNLPEQTSDCKNSTNENQKVETRSEHDEETNRDRHLTWEVERFEDQRNTGVQILVWTNSQVGSSTSRVNINDMRRSEMGTIPLHTTHLGAEGTKNPYKDVRNQFELPEYQPVVNLTRLEDFQGDITMKDQSENDTSHENPMHNQTDEQMQPLLETAAVSANEENPAPEHVKMTSVEPNDIHERHMTDNLTSLRESRVSDLERTPRSLATPEMSMNDSEFKDPQTQDSSWDDTELRTLSAMSQLRNKFKSKFYKDQKINPKFFREGETVYLLKEPRHGKGDKHYVGPCEILEVDYESNNARIQKGDKTRVVHIDKLKNCYSSEDDSLNRGQEEH